MSDVQGARVAFPPSDADLPSALESAMADYGNLLDELQAGAIDDATFHRRALSIGLIVRESEAWILELSTQRWWRYDGVELRSLGTVGPDEGAEEG